LLLTYSTENSIGKTKTVNKSCRLIFCLLTSSDICVKLDGETLFGHRFVLAARSIKWDSQQLGDATELDLSGK
jgi:hypothetical protein